MSCVHKTVTTCTAPTTNEKHHRITQTQNFSLFQIYLYIIEYFCTPHTITHGPAYS